MSQESRNHEARAVAEPEGFLVAMRDIGPLLRDITAFFAGWAFLFLPFYLVTKGHLLIPGKPFARRKLWVV